MAKQTATLPLVLPPREADVPASRWLGSVLRAEILGGRVRPGARLPATRDLAKQYGLSRGTIVSAFEQLKAEGYLEGSVGSGTYVKEVVPDHLLRAARTGDARSSPAPLPPRRLSDFARQVKSFPLFSSGPTRPFRANQPALALFPTTLWAQIAARRLRRVTTRHLLGSHPMGYRRLRIAVTDYLTTSRGVQCEPEQVAIVSGVQEALDLAARLFVNPGERVCVEDPGYVGASLVFEARGARVTPVRVDDEGMEVPSARLHDVRLAYVTPGHQFPLGTCMSLARRRALLEWARCSGAVLFEDDYDSEFRYVGRPVPALQGLDRHGVVLFAGSFSKVLFPSLRLGYLVVPSDLVDQVAAIKSITNRHAPTLDQAVLSDFIAEGHFARHLRRMREVYAERVGVLQESAGQRLTGLLQIPEVEAGLQTVGWLGDGLDVEAAATATARRDLETVSISRYCYKPPSRDGLLLGFAAVDAPDIRRGVLELAAALEEASPRS
jgi:GntR family transcriptional regulator/MocR family aminotransferase